MSAKRITIGAVLVVLAVGGARAQGPMPPPAETLPPPAPSMSPAEAILRPYGEPIPRGGVGCPGGCGFGAGCCSPLTGSPIGEELILRTGPSVPFGSSILSEEIETGWMIAGGMRTLLFNPSATAAWTIDTTLHYQYNNGKGGAEEFSFFGLPVNVRDLHRWYVGVGVGREWWLLGSACNRSGTNVRFGLDIGGRYGTEHVNLNLFGEFPEDPVGYLRRHDVMGGLYLGGQLGFEVPIGNWWWFGGLRVEWAQTWSDLLPNQANSDVRDTNILLTTGVRF